VATSGQTGRGHGGEEGEGGEHRRRGRPRNRSYDRVILDATLEILNAEGYAGLTIDSVAARTGVGRPTIYRRWSSKAALVIAALTQSPGLSPVPNTGRVRDDLLAFEADQVRMMDQPASRRITAGLVADLVADPELADTYVRDYIGLRRASVWQALQRGIDRGELRPDADLALIYDMLIGPLFMRAVVRGEQLGPDMAAKTVDSVLAAYRPSPKTQPRRAAIPANRPAARRSS
jgi:AcrR family transcriptional regulator